MNIESIFISDVHLGQSGWRAAELLEFLGEMDTKNFFIVGDLTDFWAMRRSVCWPQAHQDVLRTLVDRARSGVRVVYLPDNHDKAAREFVGMSICGVEIRRQLVHRAADGRRLLLLHGDEFDSEVRCGRIRIALGDALYSAALAVNNLLYRARRIIGLPEWSLTAWLKRSVSDARSYIALFEASPARAAARAGCDGVVCGHIHQPATREIEGVLYMNDGDWVENCTALVETASGRLSLVRWSRVLARARVQRSLRLLGSSKA